MARRAALAAVVAISQAVGLAGVAVIVAAGGEPAPPVSELLPAAGGGIAGMIALAAFYRGLAIGTMSIVAPISATGAGVPVVVGLATGDRPGTIVLAGIVLAVLGVVLAAREETPEAGAGETLERSVAAATARRAVLLALVAALGFGTFFVGMDASADADVFWALLAARSASVTLLLIALLVLRPPLPSRPRTVALIAAVGAGDLAANGCFAAATTSGLLSVVAVLGSLYPVVTVLLARVFLGERVRREQEAGIAAVLVGVALIAGGA